MSLTAVLPSLYEFYTTGGISSGLSVDQPYFTLNNRNITIYSGAMHYFRVPKEYWRDRLRKIRAAGLNTVETYVPWNLHEPEEGVFDFGQGGSDMQELLNIQRFLETAKEEDLFTIVRPGPFICSEWEFGGLPSWLLRYKGLKVRTSEKTFMQKVTNYFNILLPILALLQFTRGGSVIAVQVENEYGSTSEPGRFIPDRIYLEQLRQLMLRNGIEELMFTSDSPTAHGDEGTLPGVLFQTANFASNPEKEFDALEKLQPRKPFMAMEFWTGWFDHWSELHHVRDNDDFYNVLDRILKYPASVNMYMFHGGTSFGFMNGANIADGSVDNEGYQPDTNSYDYDAPLSEAGDYTMKYVMVKELISKYNQIKTRIPEAPAITLKTAYHPIPIEEHLGFEEILEQVPKTISSPKVMPMELLPHLNNNSGQSFGYIVYRKENIDIPKNSTLMIKGRVCDTVMVLVNGYLISKPLTLLTDLNDFGYWRWKDSKLDLGVQGVKSATIDLVVENWGRNNFGSLDQFIQYKGLWQGGVFLNKEELTDFKIYPVEFKRSFNSNLKNFHLPINPWLPAPSIFRATLRLNKPQDTFLDMSEWTKGIVIVNNFVLGRYAAIGPQQTLYLPAPFLKVGNNSIMVFEHFYPADKIRFRAAPFYKTQNASPGMVSIIIS